MSVPARPLLVFIVGPPAVGKMTVGTELARRTGLRLFHNHHTIDLVLQFFPYGTPPFQRLNGEFRRRIFEEVAASELPGLIFTYVWAFDHESDAAAVEEYASIFRARSGRVVFVELEATQAERLRRNETELRQAFQARCRAVAATADRNRRDLSAELERQVRRTIGLASHRQHAALRERRGRARDRRILTRLVIAARRGRARSA